MTLFEVEELCRYWADHPPLHVTVRAIAGRQRHIRPPPETRRSEAIVGELGTGFAVGDVDDGLPPVVLAFEQLRTLAR